MHWQLTPWIEVDLVIRLLISVVFGGAIGYERRRAGKPAGLRTNSLVCMGATLFTIASVYGFGESADPSRVAAAIAVGIGFIGAGTIIKHEREVAGLTTAASVWAASGTGARSGPVRNPNWMVI